MMPLDYQLIKTLKRGAGLLSECSHSSLCGYVKSQMTDNSTFKNRAGKEDLYYTMFGWMLCYVLNIETKRVLRKKFLSDIDFDSLDSLHKKVFQQCILLDDLLSRGIILAALRHLGEHRHIEEFFGEFERHTVTETLNGTAAGLFTKKKSLTKTEKAERLMQIASLQDETGGFYQNESAQIPDILSTAVALFTLSSFGVRARYDASDFIEAHFNDDGSFAPNLLDTQSDVEYCFYGVLALGSILK